MRTTAPKDHISRLWKYYLRARRLGGDFRGWRGYCGGWWRPEENLKEHKPVYSPSWKLPTGPHPQCSQSEKTTKQCHRLCCVDPLPSPTLLGSLAEGPQLPCKDATQRAFFRVEEASKGRHLSVLRQSFPLPIQHIFIFDIFLPSAASTTAHLDKGSHPSLVSALDSYCLFFLQGPGGSLNKQIWNIALLLKSLWWFPLLWESCQIFPRGLWGPGLPLTPLPCAHSVPVTVASWMPSEAQQVQVNCPECSSTICLVFVIGLSSKITSVRGLVQPPDLSHLSPRVPITSLCLVYLSTLSPPPGLTMQYLLHLGQCLAFDKCWGMNH